MNRILMVLTVLLSISCKTGNEAAQDKTSEIIYTKDTRTGLCFAINNYWGMDRAYSALASVPCEKVKHLIK